MKLYPADYREIHSDEIRTTIRDARDDSDLRIGVRDSLSLAIAGIRIRMRSYRSQDWFVEVERGLSLGVRVALFAIAVGAVAFVRPVAIEGRSIYGCCSFYQPTERLLVVAALVPWIGVFLLQVHGWWRAAMTLAGIGFAAAAAYVFYKLALSSFGTGPGTAAVLVIAAAGLTYVIVGAKAQLPRVRYPIATTGLWAGAAITYTAYLHGELLRMPRSAVAAGVVAGLIAVVMAVGKKPRGLIACAMLILPFWMLSAGVFYMGGPSIIEFLVWTLASTVAAAALSGLGLAIAAK
jgi:hypothetical protein